MWTLIITITFGLGMDGKAAAIHSVDGFRTAAACQAARTQVETMDRVKAVCVLKP